MRFALTAEQDDLRQVVADLMAKLCPPSVVRSAPDSPAVGTLAAGLADLGAPGLLVPEDAGGLGLDEVSLVPLLTEVGRAAAPLPVLETVAVAPGVLLAAGLLDDVLAGTTAVGADPSGRGLVRYGTRAGLLLSGGAGGTGAIRVLDLSGAAREPVAAVDPAADLQQVSGARELAVVDDPDVVHAAWLRGALGAAAELVGLSWRMLDMTVEYVGSRTQFGVPIGSFQAVKHHLATALLQVEFAAPVVARAALSLAAGEAEVIRDVAAAKAMASDAARLVARTTIQCHGAIGYTTEYDLHLFAKRAWALAAEWGSAAWHRARVAESLGLPLPGSLPAA
ncbi:acyl-CoA dehydrogenase family protein [Blastococcus sp. SYSU D00820]